jgi:sugar phosphate isomerase/epimerase
MTAAYLLLSTMLLTAAPASRPAAEAPAVAGLPNAFFAMDTATRDERHETIEVQLKMLKDLGFAGWSSNITDTAETLKVADSLGLKWYAVYSGIDLDQPAPGWNPRLPEVVRALKGRQTVLWIFITSKEHPAGCQHADAESVARIQRVADLAAESGLTVSLYPHNGFTMQSIHDALRIREKVNRKNVKVTFNLCHWLKVDRGDNLDAVLKEALPHLDFVTINGADADAQEWDRLIQPLGKGSYDVCGLLGKLRALGYRGPVGLQGYGIKGDVREHLTLAMKTWTACGAKLAGK